MDYKMLEPDQQRTILKSRMADYERQHFELGLNLGVAKAVGDTDNAEALAGQMDTIDVAYAELATKLAAQIVEPIEQLAAEVKT